MAAISPSQIRVFGLLAAACLFAATGQSRAAQAPDTSTQKSGGAQQGQPQSKPQLRESVLLLGADDKDLFSLAVPRGSQPSLTLVVRAPVAGHPRGMLRAMPFTSADQPPDVAVPRIRVGDGGDTIDLEKPGERAVALEFDRLRPAKVYKGQLFLSSADLVHHWDLTLTTGGRGALSVAPVGPLKFVRFPPSNTGLFSFTLYDKVEAGPYHHVHVRFEPAGGAPSKATTSTFTLDSLSFWEREAPRNPIAKETIPATTSAAASDSGMSGFRSVDLAQRDAGSEGSDSGVTLAHTRTFTARIDPLSPGEYSGTLLFAADETAEDAAESKLPLTIQVRHHWVLPVAVILFGSVVGWFSSKYIVGARKARGVARQTRDLRARADFLARPSPSRAGWQFATEASSLGLARVRVALSQLASLTASPLPILVREGEIQQLRDAAELRLTSLESLSAARRRVEPVADGRPAAQLAIGRLLRSCTELLERPTFGETERAALAKLLELVDAWTNPATFAEKYRDALLTRRRSSECPDLADVQALTAGPVRAQLEALAGAAPTEQVIAAATAPADLHGFDVKLAQLSLMWREREQPWATELAAAAAAGSTLDNIFHQVDTSFWKTLRTLAQNNQLTIERDATRQETPQTYDVIETHLAVQAPGLKPSRILYHPLHVGWRVIPTNGSGRSTETDGLTLVQYFSSPGRVTIKAALRWLGEEIPIQEKNPMEFEVTANAEYLGRRMFTEWTEWAAIAIAVLFAVVTAMSTQYDATFGSFAQYLTLLIWAAGAGTGGNLFSQLGTTGAAGGRTDSTLSAPART